LRALAGKSWYPLLGVVWLAACGAGDVATTPTPVSIGTAARAPESPLDGGADAGHASADGPSAAAPDGGSDQAARDRTAWEDFQTAEPALAVKVVFAKPEVAALPPPEPGTVACGSARCVVGKEHCCAFRRWGAEARAAYHCQAPQARIAGADGACRQAPMEARGDKWECDDSSDCGPAAMCCDDYVNMAYELAYLCARVKKPGHNVCLWHERCGNGGKCKTSGTRCREGICVPADPRVVCGARTCPSESPVCCVPRAGGEPRCADSAASCSDGETPRECTRGAQCGAGMSCCGTPAKQYCSRDCTNAQVICGGDAECQGQWTGGRCVGATVGLGNGVCSK